MKNFIKNLITINRLFWTTYIGLLIVMLPHNAWTAQQFFNDKYTGWAFAIVFECAILAFTIMLKDQIVSASRLRKGDWLFLRMRKFSRAYLNIYTFGLIVCCFISGLANFSYVVEFSNSIQAISEYDINILVYEISFGAALPLISVLFARVLASVNEFKGVEEKTEAAEKLENELKNLREELKNKQNFILTLNDNILELKTELNYYKIFQTMLNGKSKEEKMNAVLSVWPKMPKSGIAAILDVSPATITGMTKEKKSDF